MKKTVREEMVVVEEQYCFNRDEALFIYKLIGQMSDIDVANILGVPTITYTNGKSDTFHYLLWKELNEVFVDDPL